MIVVYVNHGLGNQMFQYAYGIVLGKKTSLRNIRFDLSDLDRIIAGRKTNDINKIFKGNFPRCDFWSLWKITGYCPWIYLYKRKYSAQAESVQRAVRGKTIFVEEPQERWKITPELVNELCYMNWVQNENYYVRGYWENVRYFSGYEKLIQKHFQFLHEYTAIEKHKYRKLFSENSVAIHVRRGDYLKLQKTDRFDLCGEEYYREAIEIMLDKVENPLFCFFSDDPDYVQKKYSWVKNMTIIKGNKDYIDLQLMSDCKHNILANSTFSFWGAFLNSNNDKVVICPRVHYLKFRAKWHEIPFPAAEKWIKIDNHQKNDCDNIF